MQLSWAIDIVSQSQVGMMCRVRITSAGNLVADSDSRTERKYEGFCGNYKGDGTAAGWVDPARMPPLSLSAICTIKHSGLYRPGAGPPR